jgi:GT2 family glycosyltransferase
LDVKTGIVVPTLGSRPEYLVECLKSIRLAGRAHVLLVAPEGFDNSPLFKAGLIDQSEADPKNGLSAAINAGIRALPPDIEYVNWLGDDDLLAPGSLDECIKVLTADSNTVMVFGSCDYIDPQGRRLWTNNSGQWAVPLLRFGPDLIPQPGALFRRNVFESVGGLSLDFDWAFDFDLFIKFSKAGKIKFIDSTLASFRWHPESLSVEFRAKSVAEASRVRTSHLPKALRWISALWEYPVKQATVVAGNRVSNKAKRLAE